ncbi:MAG: CidA/LrgA family protein [Tissierellia bacterium]|nr:CidA/LrgA family protein [Tissierellia bacterium]
MKAIFQIFVLLACLLAGTGLKNLLGLPIPETVYGMVIFFLVLKLGWLKVHQVDHVAETLVGFLALFFIPALVNLVNVYPQVAGDFGKILASSLISLVLTFIATGKTVAFLQGRFSHDQ